MFERALNRGRGGNNNPEGRNQHEKPAESEATSKTEEVNDGNSNIDQNKEKQTRGYTSSYSINRLSRERPDLLDRVKAKELSLHGAMVEAGFRKVPTVLDNLNRAWAKASPAEKLAFLQAAWAGRQRPRPTAPANLLPSMN